MPIGSSKASERKQRQRFEQLLREEQRLREQISDFPGSDRLPRDELYRRGADDPTRPTEE